LFEFSRRDLPAHLAASVGPLLRPCVAALKELASNYGSSVVLSTATQPALQAETGGKYGFPDGYLKLRELAAKDVPALQINCEASAVQRADCRYHDRNLVIGVLKERFAFRTWSRRSKHGTSSFIHPPAINLPMPDAAKMHFSGDWVKRIRRTEQSQVGHSNALQWNRCGV
jgi:hypothetical protein